MKKIKSKLDPRTVELRRLMRQHGLSARQVAALVGRSRQAVKRWTGEFTIIDAALLELLKYKLRERDSVKA